MDARKPKLPPLEKPCRFCGEFVRLSTEEYLQVERTGELPVCRKNGCWRFLRVIPWSEKGGDRPHDVSVDVGECNDTGEQRQVLESRSTQPPLAKRVVKQDHDRLCGGGGAVSK